MTELEFESEQIPSAGTRAVRRHGEVLSIACLVWVVAFLLCVLPDGRVAVRGLPQFPLPHTCASRAWLGLRCPGCGLTRSIIHLAEGNWRASWHDHRLGALLALCIALQIPYRLLAIRRPERTFFSTRWQTVMGYALIVLLIGNWVVDVAAGRLSSP